MNHAEVMIHSLVIESKAVEAEIKVMQLHDQQKIETYAVGLYSEASYEPLIARLRQIQCEIRSYAEQL